MSDERIEIRDNTIQSRGRGISVDDGVTVLRVGRWLIEFDTAGLPVRMRPTKPEEAQ